MSPVVKVKKFPIFMILNSFEINRVNLCNKLITKVSCFISKKCGFRGLSLGDVLPVTTAVFSHTACGSYPLGGLDSIRLLRV